MSGLESSTGRKSDDGSVAELRSKSRSNYGDRLLHPYKTPRASVSKPFSRSPHKTTEDLYTWARNSPVTTDHTAQRLSTALAWKNLLPKLVYPYMEWQAACEGARRADPVEHPSTKCIACSGGSLKANVNVISFTSRYQSSFVPKLTIGVL